MIQIGRLVRDPELKYTQNGNAVANFTIAVNDNFDKEKAYFFDCVAWRKTAEYVANYGAKGRQIAIEGKLTTRTYENKEDRNVKVWEISVDQVQFLDKNPKQQESTEDEWSGLGQEVLGNVEIPF